jgi:hypothetical protein
VELLAFGEVKYALFFHISFVFALGFEAKSLKHFQYSGRTG